MRTGGQILVDTLIENRVDTVFGVPGESYLAVLDAIHDAGNAIRFITCRHEGGAAFMADAYGMATNAPGVCLVTRGPGATNASIAVHNAFQASSPLLLLVGQVPRGQMEREVFQEIDYRRMFAQMSKWVAQVDDPARLPELMTRALRTAVSGRPGPVVLALPEDMLGEDCDTPDLPAHARPEVHPAPTQMVRLRDLLSEARKPLLLLGGTGWDAAGREAIHAFAAANDLPVATAFRRQSLFDNDHPCYVGNLGFAGMPHPNDYLLAADTVLAVGTRLGDGTTLKYRLIAAGRPDQKVIHIHPGAEELGRVVQADLMIQAGVNETAAALAALDPVAPAPWSAERAAANARYRDRLDLPPQAGSVDMGAVMKYLRATLPRDSIVTNGAGNYGDWPNCFYSYRGAATVLAPISGAMGFGVPAAVAGKLAHPDRAVVCFAGDGDFLMTGQELATAMKYGVDPVFLVINNDMYGTIRMHQEQRHPGRVSGTALANPDFAAYARSFGAHGATVERTEEFAPAFEHALSCGTAALIEVRVGADHLGPEMSVSGLRAEAKS